MSRTKTIVPWRLKVACKLLLSQLPKSQKLLKKLPIFEFGSMADPEYALNVFLRHFDRMPQSIKGKGFVALELGPGDSLFSMICARAFGASKIYLVDVGSYAEKELLPYRNMISFLNSRGYSVPEIPEGSSFEDVLELFNAEYLTDGIASLRMIPSNSVDFVWSQAVLEHVIRGEFSELLIELRRIMYEGGICSHRVDLKDHLNKALNNLRFSDQFWERPFIHRSGFYTNRLRMAEICDLSRGAGFNVELATIDRWEYLPTRKNLLVEHFQQFDEDELRVKGFDMVLMPHRPSN
ncbi:MAG: methyltransferase domain-containing protein [Bdellovibrionales bacterium]|nr:methyltransferase domain-containing protein [Bdellovibrionales bacterium]